MAPPHELPIIELSGSPRELGRRHGATLGREIRRMRRPLLQYLARLTLYAGAWPLYGLLACLARRFWPHIPTPLREELLGVAAGAHLGLGTVLLINTIDDLANNCPGCSALAAGPGYTPDGAYLMGRNLDYPLFVQEIAELQTLFLMAPHRGRPLASLAWPGYVGVCTGLNRAGVALAQLSVPSRDRSLQGMPAAMRFRQALEAEDTVTGVAHRILATPGTIGNNVMLSSPQEAAVLEVSARGGCLRRPVDGLITVTNHYQTPSMTALERPFPARPPLAVLSAYHFTKAYSQARDRRLQELAQGRKLTPTDLQRLLADEQIANPGTAVCAVFAPAEGTLWVARGAAPPVNHGPFQKIKLWG